MEHFLRLTLRFLLRLCFRVEVRGLEHLRSAGERVVIISNHQSFLDPMLLATFMDEKPAFAMNSFQAERWYFKPFMKPFRIFRIDPSKPMSMKGLIQSLKEGRKIVIFPEGRITHTGGLMKVYDGTGMIIARTGATIVPVCVEGAQYSPFSRMQGKAPLRLFPRIRLTFLPPQKLELPAGLPARRARKLAGQKLYRLMCDAMFRAAECNLNLLEATYQTSRRFGRGRVVATDAMYNQLSARGLFLKAHTLAAYIGRLTRGEQYVGLLLPTSLAGMVSFFALHCAGRVPAMLNFSAGSASVEQACRTAQLQTIITARRFIEQAKLEKLAEHLSQHFRLVYLEDIRDQLTPGHKLRGILRGVLFPARYLPKAMPHEVAALLFTSGSEGVPKGVALSHRNILSNIHQALARIDIVPSDIVFNALPMFHSFGLSIGTFLPLVRGMKVFMHPSPLHYRTIPELCYDSRATILLGTDTFLNGYAQFAHSYDFSNVRFAVAGAEKLREETRRLWADRFGVTIFQGYGVTETSPVLSVNTPLEHRHGSVGCLLPAMEHKIEAVDGISDGGRLWVKGPNVMLGYMKADQPGVIQSQGAWYDTGDIVSVDEDGFIFIRGRAKRFAKIGGEMVSLAAVEECAASLWPSAAHAAIAMPDPRKGEQVVLITEQPDADRQTFMAFAREQGMAEITFPKRVLHLAEIPRLGSGKIDYIRSRAWLEGQWQVSE